MDGVERHSKVTAFRVGVIRAANSDKKKPSCSADTEIFSYAVKTKKVMT